MLGSLIMKFVPFSAYFFLLSQSTYNPKLYNIFKNQPSGLIRRGDLVGFLLFDLEKGLPTHLLSKLSQKVEIWCVDVVQFLDCFLRVSIFQCHCTSSLLLSQKLFIFRVFPRIFPLQIVHLTLVFGVPFWSLDLSTSLHLLTAKKFSCLMVFFLFFVFVTLLSSFQSQLRR